MLHARVALLLGGLSLTFACSSVPDVSYLDGDGGSGTSSGATPGEYHCPDNPPPAGRGVCCGERLCLRCSDGLCPRCEREGCDDDEVCCARTPGLVECRRQSSCI